MTILTRESSLGKIVAATKSDSVNQAGDWTAIILDTSGIVKFTTTSGDTITLTLSAGVWPFRVTRIWSTTTTVTTVYLGSYGPLVVN